MQFCSTDKDINCGLLCKKSSKVTNKPLNKKIYISLLTNIIVFLNNFEVPALWFCDLFVFIFYLFIFKSGSTDQQFYRIKSLYCWN